MGESRRSYAPASTSITTPRGSAAPTDPTSIRAKPRFSTPFVIVRLPVVVATRLECLDARLEAKPRSSAEAPPTRLTLRVAPGNTQEKTLFASRAPQRSLNRLSP